MLAASSFAASLRFLTSDSLSACEMVSPKTESALGAVMLMICSPRSSKNLNWGNGDALDEVDAFETMLGTTALFSRIFWLPLTE